MSIFQKLGQHPTKSFRCFLIGLLLFVLGVGYLYLGPISDKTQIISMVLVGLGCLLSIWGYLGIFSARMLTMMNHHPATKKD